MITEYGERNEFIEHYFHQSSVLPLEIRKQLDESNQQLLLYAMADFDEKLERTEIWVVLTKSRLMLFKQQEEVLDLPLSQISSVQNQRGLSCHQITLMMIDYAPCLVSINYSSRQKKAMEYLYFALDQLLKSKDFSIAVDADKSYQEGLLGPLNEKKQRVSQSGYATLKRLLSYLRPYKKELVIGLLGAGLGTGMALLPPYLSGRVIDKMIRPFQQGKLSYEMAYEMIWPTLALLLTSYLAKEFFIWIRLLKMSVLGEKVAKDLRSELYSHLQSLDMEYFGKMKTGSLISKVSSDTDRIWDFIAFGVVEVGMALVTLTGLSAVLLWLDWRLGLAMVIPVPLLLLSIYWHGESMRKMFLGAWRKWSQLTEVLSDTIPGIQVVKAFGQEASEIDRFDLRNADAVAGFNKIHRSWTSFWPLLMLAIHATILAVWFFALPRLLSGEEDINYLSAGTFVSVLLYTTMFSTPLEIVGQVARMLNRALSSAHRIFEVLDVEAKIIPAKQPKKLQVEGAIEFSNVHFSYDGVWPVLSGVDFKIKAGEMIGLVGPSGGGKSTITKLINRFYDLSQGSIMIDGFDVRGLDLPHLRKQIGMVLQEPYLFYGSIWENIAYGQEDKDKAAIIKAAKVANAHEFILTLPYGYETVIGERGHNLSGGERQRISIARAVMQNPKILILDEATSALDSETEEKIQEALDRLIEGRTVIAIAHRLSTLRRADRILVVKKGRLVEEGHHTELMSVSKGVYKKLFDIQNKMSNNFALCN